MVYKKGKNYHFFRCNPDSVARIQASPSPFYNFKVDPEMGYPSLVAEPSLIPKFFWKMHYDRVEYPTEPIFIPEYVSNSMGYKGEILPRKEGFQTQIGSKNNGKQIWEKWVRTKRVSTRYLSLRDIVNPQFSEQEVLEQIENLYFDKETKVGLSKLVKILYAGKPSEERQLIENLFTHEPEFAQFLRDRIFRVEILPLVHGLFLTEVLNRMDERVIRKSLPTLSPGVLRVIQKSVSKNKFKSIQNSPPRPDDDGKTLVDILEEEIFRRFSRKVYYEEGSFLTYRTEKELDVGFDENSTKETLEITLENPDRANFTFDRPALEFYGLTRTKFYLKTLVAIEVFRLDLFLSYQEREEWEYYRLPPNLILEFPYYPTAKFQFGGGFTKDLESFEFYVQFFDY